MLEGLGDTDERGHGLLGLLERASWTITRRTTVGDGILLIGTGHATSVSAAGDILTAAAAPLFERVMALRRSQRAA